MSVTSNANVLMKPHTTKRMSSIKEEYKELYWKIISNKKRFYPLLPTIKRIFEIGLFAAEVYFRFIVLPSLCLSRDRFFSENKRKKYLEQQGKWLNRKLQGMEAVFIKAGQFMSLRPDILDNEICEKLKELQDKVPSFSPKLAKQIIERELKSKGKTFEECFSHFEEDPIAAASIGQVHRAILKGSGKQVVVKVQRPKVFDSIKCDLVLFRQLIVFIQNRIEIIKRLNRVKINDWIEVIQKQNLVRIFDDYAVLLLLETNYLHELENAEKFQKNLAPDTKVIIPSVYRDFSSQKILTMEYCKGDKLSGEGDFNFINKNTKKKIARIAGDCFVKQVLDNGWFHADPHGGNLAVTTSGELILYDYGMVLELPTELSEKFSVLTVAFVIRDVNKIVEILIELDIVDSSINKAELAESLNLLLVRLLSQPITNLLLEDIFDDIFEIVRCYKMRVQAEIVIVIKAAITLETIVKKLDPSYDFTYSTIPYVWNFVQKEISNSSSSESLRLLWDHRDILFRLALDNAPSIILDNTQPILDLFKVSENKKEKKTMFTLDFFSIFGFYVVLISLMGSLENLFLRFSSTLLISSVGFFLLLRR
jgi:predicted unusual protein kinase regulating ubiquinone biosynthesis (AarF/ABC1/UbiB family)